MMHIPVWRCETRPNTCSSHEVHMLFKHDYNLQIHKMAPGLLVLVCCTWETYNMLPRMVILLRISSIGPLKQNI